MLRRLGAGGLAMPAMLAALMGAGSVRVRPVNPAELPAGLRADGEWIGKINRETAARLREGEADHLIFYALQSRAFTELEPIEPSRSARAWHDGGRIPEDAAKRLAEFRAAKPKGERQEYFARMLGAGFDLKAEYERAMKFLYEKEWSSRAKEGDERRAFIAGLYTARGHSSDSSLEANYAVYVSLEALKKRVPGLRVKRVLLVGPGLDWAPRTGLHEESPPQSYQPYALADSLLRLGLAGAGELRIDAADINPRVIGHLEAFPKGKRRLWLRYGAGDEPWNAFFDGLGAAIGVRGEGAEGKWLEVSEAASRMVRPVRWNVLTERAAPAGQYDLVVATNVLLYFDRRELGLAMANMADALQPGGYLLHNDTREEVEELGRMVGLPVEQVRMVRLDLKRPLYDAGVVQRKRRP